MTIDAKALVAELVSTFEANPTQEVNELEELVYGIQKTQALHQRKCSSATCIFQRYLQAAASNRGLAYRLSCGQSTAIKHSIF